MKKSLLSLFSGCGGMDVGFEGGFKVPKGLINRAIHENWIIKEDETSVSLEDTIFETKFANDICNYAKAAWSDYFSKKRGTELNGLYKIGSIVDLVKKYKAGDKGVFPTKIDIVTGGFPCQDFSVSGKRNGLKSHKSHNGEIIIDEIPTEETRGSLYIWMREVIKITKPNVFVAENVKGLSNLGKVKDIIQNDFSNIEGESYLLLTPKILHAGNYGIAQSRERIFLLDLRNRPYQKKRFLN